MSTQCPDQHGALYRTQWHTHFTATTNACYVALQYRMSMYLHAGCCWFSLLLACLASSVQLKRMIEDVEVAGLCRHMQPFADAEGHILLQPPASHGPFKYTRESETDKLKRIEQRLCHC